MNIEFKYSVIYDLIYHILAQIKVDNASNLYSEDYVLRWKNDSRNSIYDKAKHLSKYYNENFERLGIINFIPCYCSSLSEFKNALLTYPSFTENDKKMFVSSLIEIIDSENVYYNEYWLQLYKNSEKEREKIERWIKTEFNKYEVFFSFFNKPVNVCFSYSLTRNGRGYFKENSFNAVVPFEFEESKYYNAFYQALHEITHQLTDEIIGTDIKMNDGTHDISENSVILFDYYLIKKMNFQNINSYLKWANTFVKADCSDEESFFNCFAVEDSIKEKLMGLLNKIL